MCASCYVKPEIRDLYPSALSLHCLCGNRLNPNPAHRRDGRCGVCRRKGKVPDRIVEAERLLPTVGTGPSSAVPHSAARLALLINRAEQGLPLWDPRDNAGDLT
ncbi:MAG: hypothetical protein IT429_22710 [Gemmataceae bacterium]|nr:hypothetical protein [Gemmataceae bacterium]